MHLFMNVDEALKHFRSGYEMCQKIGAHTAALSRWKKTGGWIPIAKQIKINEVTGLDLPIDLTKELMEKRINKE
ncbi:Uncharacterised protein [Legionella pneumophila]|uniref:Uncharacterized protein n=2 Tax=Legionella pneumophila TaxID=446 RepID=A0A128UFP8_LEGPN|nr:hypothetical protein [Legionella pneumophila]CZH71917.1 Uncharacterised protein [Legionella pneumophila]CZH80053.1 Uncharacterised protein [Legionella pneumophila]CZH80939.1 Uncharacterised protein [Legionella pneumophila]CZH81152.1 Uncharacterised protein [Legionella pneumophila]